VVVWHLRHPGRDSDHITAQALRLVAGAFFVLGVVVTLGAVWALATDAAPGESPIGIAYLTVTVVVMLSLGAGPCTRSSRRPRRECAVRMAMGRPCCSPLGRRRRSPRGDREPRGSKRTLAASWLEHWAPYRVAGAFRLRFQIIAAPQRVCLRCIIPPWVPVQMCRCFKEYKQCSVVAKLQLTFKPHIGWPRTTGM